jgi:uncharacterized membrane protein YebE (DUF533 family)
MCICGGVLEGAIIVGAVSALGAGGGMAGKMLKKHRDKKKAQKEGAPQTEKAPQNDGTKGP